MFCIICGLTFMWFIIWGCEILPIFLNNCYKLFSTFSYKSHTLLLRIVRLDIALGSSYSNSSTTLSSSLCTLKESTCKLIFLFYAKNCSLTQFFDVYQQTSKIIQIIFLQGENVIIVLQFSDSHLWQIKIFTLLLALWKKWVSISLAVFVVGFPDCRMASSLQKKKTNTLLSNRK
jgi:hypothetical protein